MIFGCLNPKYTNVNEWLTYLEHNTDKWYYNKGCYKPQKNDIIYVYQTGKLGLVASVKVIDTGCLPQTQSIVSDLQNRISRRKGYYVLVCLVEKYNPVKPELIQRCELYGRRQDTFKVNLEEYAKQLAESFEGSTENLEKELRLELEGQPESFIQEVTAEVIANLNPDT